LGRSQEEGEKEAQIKIINRLLEAKMDLDFIATATGLSIEEIRVLQESI
jgi:predicted transposase YdaD